MSETFVVLIMLVLGYGIGYNVHQIALARMQEVRIPVRTERRK